MALERAFADGTRIVTTPRDGGWTRVGLEAEGRDASRAYIIPLLMRVGRAVVRMDGIGGVGTEEDLRNRGYSRRVLESAIEVMRAGNAALTTLYGIPDFYPKYGYATCGPEYTLHLPLADVPPALDTLPDGWTFAPLTTTDIPAVHALYHQQTRRATGAIVRKLADDETDPTLALANASPDAIQASGRSWSDLATVANDPPHDLAAVTTEPDKDACRVLHDASGAVAGYAWMAMKGWWVQTRDRPQPGPIHLGEVLARDGVAADALVGAVRSWVREAIPTATHVEVVMPPEGPVAHAAALQDGVSVARHTRDGEFMARLLDIGRLFAQLEPELSALVQAARTGFTGTLAIRTDEGEADLGIGDDGVTLEPVAGERLAVVLPQDVVARLAFGAYDVAEVLARLPNPPDERVTGLLGVLFPRRHPHVHAIDRF